MVLKIKYSSGEAMLSMLVFVFTLTTVHALLLTSFRNRPTTEACRENEHALNNVSLIYGVNIAKRVL